MATYLCRSIRLLVIPCLFLISCSDSSLHEPEAVQPQPIVESRPEIEPQVQPQSVTVYVTRTGEKYHRDGCRYLRQSKIPMTLDNARARYDACKVCTPPG